MSIKTLKNHLKLTILYPSILQSIIHTFYGKRTEIMEIIKQENDRAYNNQFLSIIIAKCKSFRI